MMGNSGVLRAPYEEVGLRPSNQEKVNQRSKWGRGMRYKIRKLPIQYKDSSGRGIKWESTPGIGTTQLVTQ